MGEEETAKKDEEHVTWLKSITIKPMEFFKEVKGVEDGEVGQSG